MNIVLISAVLAYAAASDKSPTETAEGADAGQTVRIISLEEGHKSGGKSADNASPVFLMPPSPPLVAFVQEDGSIIYRHSAEHMKPVAGSESTQRKPQ